MAEENFQPVHSLVDLSVCPRCSAVTTDPKRHLEWHERLGKRLKRAMQHIRPSHAWR